MLAELSAERHNSRIRIHAVWLYRYTLPNDSMEPFRLLSAETLIGDIQLICPCCFTTLEQMVMIWITLTVSQ